MMTSQRPWAHRSRQRRRGGLLLRSVVATLLLLTHGCGSTTGPPPAPTASAEAPATGEASPEASGAETGDGSDPPFLHEWPSRCAALRQELASSPQASLTYTARPTYEGPPVSRLRVDGVSVPLPDLPYRHVLLPRGPGGLLEMHAVAADGVRISVLVREEEASDDFFATVGLDGTINTSEGGREWTKRLFGGPVRMEDLMDRSYRHRPSDLTCEAARWKTEVPTAIALFLAGIGGGAARAVHRGAVADRGWIVRSVIEREGRPYVAWDAHVPGTPRSRQVVIQVPRDSPYADLGLAIGPAASAENASPTPPWLAPLERVFGDPGPEDWRALREAFAAAGLSEKSLERVDQLAGAAADPSP